MHDLEAVHLRQHQIENNRVGPLPRNCIQRLAAVGCQSHPVASPGE